MGFILFAFIFSTSCSWEGFTIFRCAEMLKFLILYLRILGSDLSTHLVKAGHLVHLSECTLHRQWEHPQHSWPLLCNQHRVFCYCPAPDVMVWWWCRDAWQVPSHSSWLPIRTLYPPLSWCPLHCFVPGWRKFAGLLCGGGFDTDLVPFWELYIMNKVITSQLTWWDSLLLLIELDAEGKWGRASWGKSFRRPNSWQLLRWQRNRKQ